jgi:hypothetical protein
MAYKLGLFALFGFGAVILAGPLLAMLAVVMAFALVGFLFWLPLHALLRGPRPGGWQPCRDHFLAHWRHLKGHCRGTAQALQAWGRDLPERVRHTVAVAAAVVLEMASGAVVGGLFVYLSEREHVFPPLTIVTGVLVGALVGLLVVLSRPRPAPSWLLEPVAAGRPPFGSPACRGTP